LQFGDTPLFIAAGSGYDKVVEVLVQASADVNAANKV
jgi:ankyrin repeat protein